MNKSDEILRAEVDRSRKQCNWLFAMLLRLWNSPTFTTWGNQAAQSLRLLAVFALLDIGCFAFLLVLFFWLTLAGNKAR